MLYCLQLARIMLSIIYISFLAHRKTRFDLVHLKASREYPCEFQHTFHTRCQLAMLAVRRVRQAILRHHGTRMKKRQAMSGEIEWFQSSIIPILICHRHYSFTVPVPCSQYPISPCPRESTRLRKTGTI